jgi:pyruvate carboxylase subunit B
MTQEFIDDFLGYWINPKNRYTSSLLVGSGLPGGMMGSMMADLGNIHTGINTNLAAQDKKQLTLDDLLVMLFDEVQYVWPKLGNPPLVTPFSQYVKNIALLNIMSNLQGGKRFSNIDNNTWDMIIGKAGTLPGTLAPEIIALAKEQNKEFYTGVPQDLYPDVLDKYRTEMKELGWETGEDDEELLEFAMHERQYRDYKSGIAKKRFLAELQTLKNKSGEVTSLEKTKPSTDKTIKDIIAPCFGRIFFDLTLDLEEEEVKLGDMVNMNKRICYIESYSSYEEITSKWEGEIIEINYKQGDIIHKDDIIGRIKIKK